MDKFRSSCFLSIEILISFSKFLYYENKYKNIIIDLIIRLFLGFEDICPDELFNSKDIRDDDNLQYGKFLSFQDEIFKQAC